MTSAVFRLRRNGEIGNVAEVVAGPDAVDRFGERERAAATSSVGPFSSARTKT